MISTTVAGMGLVLVVYSMYLTMEMEGMVYSILKYNIIMRIRQHRKYFNQITVHQGTSPDTPGLSVFMLIKVTSSHM